MANAEPITWEGVALAFLKPDEPPPRMAEADITAAIGPHPGFASIPALQDWQRRRRELLNPPQPRQRKPRKPKPATQGPESGERQASPKHHSRLTEGDVRSIRRRRGQGEGRQAVAEDYGVSIRMIDLITSYKRWANI